MMRKASIRFDFLKVKIKSYLILSHLIGFAYGKTIQLTLNYAPQDVQRFVRKIFRYTNTNLVHKNHKRFLKYSDDSLAKTVYEK